MRPKYHPVALTAAVTGGDVFKSLSPHTPVGVEEIVEECVRAAEAGASCVHVHGRQAPDGRPTGEARLLAEITSGVRERSDVVLNLSTGGSPGMSEEERLGVLDAGAPEIATFNLGTMNYELFPDPKRRPKVEYEWEEAMLAKAGETVFVNTLGTMRRLAERCRELSITPELEAYDLGHLRMARFLIDEGTLEPPVRLQLVLGVLGAAGAELDDLFVLKQAAERLLGRHLSSIGVAATGFPAEFRHCAAAFGMGLDCRVGLEDNLRVQRNRQAESNADLVEVAVKLGDLLARPIMKPKEMRASLGPWYSGRQDVA